MEIKGRKFESGRLGMDLVVYEIDGKEWFRGTDVAMLLEYSDTSTTIRDRVSLDYKLKKYIKSVEIIGNGFSDHSEILNNVTFISESGLYQLVFKSSMSKAIEFQKWVYEEVLPSLRQNNFYVDKDNINKNQIEELKEYLFDLCESGKISLGKASKMLFGNESELKKRFVNLGWINYDNCTFEQKRFKASNEKEYELFVCNMSGTYNEGVTKHQLQVSLTNAGYVWIKHQLENNKDLGKEILN